jgi:hypothetical protein
MYIKEIGFEDVCWIHVIPVRDKRRALANSVRVLGFHEGLQISLSAQLLLIFGKHPAPCARTIFMLPVGFSGLSVFVR